MGHVFDGVSPHMKEYPAERTFLVSKDKPVDVVKILKEKDVEILINYLPVGSEKAARFYAQCCLESGVSFINCIPVFIAPDPEWEKKFKQKKIPVIGDDVKSQIGATIIHRNLIKLFHDRGVAIDRTYQLNTGGNTDFLNMLNRKRLVSKKISKTEAVQSMLDIPMLSENIHIGHRIMCPGKRTTKSVSFDLKGEYSAMYQSILN
jgi:myo-inositol-1-phosphate synthase